jgi:RNA polymerase sigma-70 factor (ECF subfamily)
MMSTTLELSTAESCGAGVLTGRFRRTSRIVESDAQAHDVARAVARAKQGDQQALRFLYVRYADNVYSYVATLLHDDHEAEDVTQHVFAKLMTVLPKYEQRGVPFSAWIMRVARNVAVDYLRSRRAVPSEDVRDDDQSDEQGSGWERSLDLRSALAELPEDQREVIVLRHVVGLSPGEIAGRLGKTEPSIHGLHHRGRAALRAALNERGCAPTTNSRIAA